MKLIELKHLAPYLPYGLKVVVDEWGIEEMIGCLNDEVITTEDNADLSIVKPILRPLSDLTKDIEHNGEKFVPIEKIGQDYVKDGFFEDAVFGWGVATGGGDEQDYSLTLVKEDEEMKFNIWIGNEFENGYVVEENAVGYKYIQLLFEWHFDVFGLIEKGLAVDINTLKL